MKVAFHRHFAKDLIKISSSNAKGRIKSVILELEEAGSLDSFPQIKAMKGEGAYLRIRVGDYRIGLRRGIAGDGVVLLRVMHRSEIYRHFPPR